MKPEAEELRRYFALHNIRQNVIAERTGIPKATISNIFNGRRGLSRDIARKFADAYGFDALFLMTGQGELFPRRPVVNKGIITTNQNGDNTAIVPDESSLSAENAALQAKVGRLEKEVEWLRSLVEKCK